MDHDELLGRALIADLELREVDARLDPRARAVAQVPRRREAAAMSGAAPERQILMDLKSTFPCCTSGRLSSAMYSVGTPLKNAGFTRRIVPIRSAMSRGFGTIASGLRFTKASACTPTCP